MLGLIYIACFFVAFAGAGALIGLLWGAPLIGGAIGAWVAATIVFLCVTAAHY